MSWKNSRELLTAISNATADLDNPNGDVRTALRAAQIKVHAFRAAAAIYRMELDHAVRTQRLQTGSDVLPGVTFEGAEQGERVAPAVPDAQDSKVTRTA